jgi:hypothetical protein
MFIAQENSLETNRICDISQSLLRSGTSEPTGISNWFQTRHFCIADSDLEGMIEIALSMGNIKP